MNRPGRTRPERPPRRGRSRRSTKPAPLTTAAPGSEDAANAASRIVGLPGPCIVVRGARTHNLQGVDVDIPRDKLVVITGPSGSGKSSLAFDTIFAEGQRRYVESLSVAARQFLAALPKPDADLIEGLSPAVSISQDNRSPSPRATVGTVTEIHDYLRLLYARVGQVFSHKSGRAMVRHSIEDMVEAVLALPADTRFSILAPVAIAAVGDHADLLDDLRRRGFVRVAVDEEVIDLGDGIALDPGVRHTIEVYVDRLKLKDGIRGRLADSLEVAAGLTGGRVKVLALDGTEMVFSETFADLEDGLSYPEITPSLFSFNSPHGACRECDGLGRREVFDPRRLVPDPTKSVAGGAIAPLAGRHGTAMRRKLAAALEHVGESVERPFAELSAEIQIAVLEGTAAGTPADAAFEGVRPWLARRLAKSEARESHGEVTEDDADEPSGFLQQIRSYLGEVVCSACHGSRLRPEARSIKVAGRTIDQLATLSLAELAEFINALDLEGESGEVAAVVLEQVRRRLAFLLEVGLQYLTLERPAGTLSGGESQRIRLATQVGAALVGITYILDEPSIGLHQRDNDRLIATLQRLRDLGNSVLVVEHDEDTMRAADWIIDVGPAAGVAGGRIVAAGPPGAIEAHPSSVTGGYLSGRLSIPVPATRRRGNGRSVSIRGAQGHNLCDVTTRFPLGALTCVTGVSGSGKSTLIIDTLLPEAARVLNGASSYGLEHAAVDGLKHLDKVIHVDQSPIGRSVRSTPATYTGIFAELRSVFAGLPEARMRGYAPARFSFNVKGGRCEACQGEGVKRIEMHFLADLFVTCEVCHGRRYNRETLAITLRGRSIADILQMSIAQACEFFVSHPALRGKLEVLRDVGLGYVALGQRAVTLSGGEAQRIKLARELARKATGSTLFILDEPTTGLHFSDVRQLLGVFARLVDEGNTVLVIEHDLDVIKVADHVIDIGPEGGSGGGQIVASGTPEEVSRSRASHTGRYLRRVLDAP